MIPYRSVHTPCHPAEPPEVRNDDQADNSENDVLHALRYTFWSEDEVVEDVAGHEDCEVERWKVVMYVSDAAHAHEWRYNERASAPTYIDAKERVDEP